MAYRVRVTPKAREELATLSPKELRQVAHRIEALAQDPRPTGTRRLEEATHLYRIRSGDLRILYEINAKARSVLIARVGQRGNVYRRLPGPSPRPPSGKP